MLWRGLEALQLLVSREKLVLPADGLVLVLGKPRAQGEPLPTPSLTPPAQAALCPKFSEGSRLGRCSSQGQP